MPVYIKKYKGGNYFQSRIFIDKIKIDRIPADGFPLFRFETEDQTTIGSYRGGDFDLAVSMLQPERSQLDSSVKDFFFGADRDFYYLVIIVIGSQTFSGIAQQSQISADYTYSQNKYEIRLTCKDMLIEWSKRCSAVALSTLNIPNGAMLTFEEYVNKHFDGLSSDVLMITMPERTYLSRLAEFGNPAGCWVYGDFFNFITGKQNISRWEAWKEFCKGVGMNFEIYADASTVGLNEPGFFFNMFFLKDLQEQEPIQIDIIEHKEFTTAARLQWLFLKYRSLVFSGVDYSSGIFFDGTTFYDSDTDNAANHLYHACLLTLDGKVLSYVDENQVTQKIVLRDIDFKELELKQYYYDVSTGAPFGKLFPLDEADGGGMTYSRILNCATGSGQDIDRYNFKPIQRYVKENYKRYVKGFKSCKELKIVFDTNTKIKTWASLIINENEIMETFYISSIKDINLNELSAQIECIKL